MASRTVECTICHAVDAYAHQHELCWRTIQHAANNERKAALV